MSRHGKTGLHRRQPQLGNLRVVQVRDPGAALPRMREGSPVVAGGCNARRSRRRLGLRGITPKRIAPPGGGLRRGGFHWAPSRAIAGAAVRQRPRRWSVPGTEKIFPAHRIQGRRHRFGPLLSSNDTTETLWGWDMLKMCVTSFPENWGNKNRCRSLPGCSKRKL